MPTQLRRWNSMLEQATQHQELKADQGKLSIMFSVLPTAVQARLPPLHSIRKSVGMRRDAAYTSGYKLGPSPETVQRALVSANRRGAGDMDRLGAQTVVGFVAQASAVQERASGVDWKCGQQGLRLMDTAVLEADPANAGYSAAFERKAYIDGVSFLLKGLPRDLDESEAMVLRSSLPPAFAQAGLAPGASMPRAGGGGYHPAPRNVLHRSIQTAVVKLFVLLHLVTPYIILLLRQLARLERRYKVSENLVGQGIELANAFGRRSVSLSGAIYNMNDGRVGQALTNAFAWTIEGVAGGLSDGVGEGLAKVGARPEGGEW